MELVRTYPGSHMTIEACAVDSAQVNKDGAKEASSMICTGHHVV